MTAVFEVSHHGGWNAGTSPHLLASYVLNPSPQTMRTQAGVNSLVVVSMSPSLNSYLVTIWSHKWLPD